MKKIKDKSGAPADLLDLYDDEQSNEIDIYNDRWDFAEHMNFFIPACARTAYTVSLDDAKSTTKTNSKSAGEKSDSEYEAMIQEAIDVEKNDPDLVSIFDDLMIKDLKWIISINK